jgi:hypothetical protein
VVDWAFPAGFVVAAVAVLWHGLVTLPHEYADLASRGVPVRVQITDCGPGEGGDSHGYGCRLRTDVDGHVHQWRVNRDVRVQAGPDGAANGLADPLHPDRSALAEDVDHRARTPERAAFTAGFLAVMAVLTAGAALWVRRRPIQQPGQNPV